MLKDLQTKTAKLSRCGSPCAHVELHYTTTLQDSDGVAAVSVPDTFTLSYPANEFDVLNITAGLHLEIAETSTLRIAAVAPLTGNGPDNRFFDAELQVVFNRRY